LSAQSSPYRHPVKSAARTIGRIESLEECLKALKTKQQRIEARPGTLKARPSRREDTRCKILAGAIVVAKVEQGVLPDKVLRGWLATALARADDRALFGHQERR
jgi:hypothetical protein